MDNKKAAKQLRSDMCMCFKSEHGKRVLEYLCEYANVFTQPSTDEAYLDANAVIMMNGQRDVVLEIIRIMKLKDEEIIEELY